MHACYVGDWFDSCPNRKYHGETTMPGATPPLKPPGVVQIALGNADIYRREEVNESKLLGYQKPKGDTWRKQNCLQRQTTLLPHLHGKLALYFSSKFSGLKNRKFTFPDSMSKTLGKYIFMAFPLLFLQQK